MTRHPQRSGRRDTPLLRAFRMLRDPELVHGAGPNDASPQGARACDDGRDHMARAMLGFRVG